MKMELEMEMSMQDPMSGNVRKKEDNLSPGLAVAQRAKRRVEAGWLVGLPSHEPHQNPPGFSVQIM
jgi:hypothetical protein